MDRETFNETISLWENGLLSNGEAIYSLSLWLARMAQKRMEVEYERGQALIEAVLPQATFH